MADVVLGIDRLQILVLGEVDLSLDPQHVVLQRDVEVLLFDAANWVSSETGSVPGRVFLADVC